jgi:hypothetical protein
MLPRSSILSMRLGCVESGDSPFPGKFEPLVRAMEGFRPLFRGPASDVSIFFSGSLSFIENEVSVPVFMFGPSVAKRPTMASADFSGGIVPALRPG